MDCVRIARRALWLGANGDFAAAGRNHSAAIRSAGWFSARAAFVHLRGFCVLHAWCGEAAEMAVRWLRPGDCRLLFYLYRDTARINRMEEQAERLVRTIPAGQRVLSTIDPPDGSRVFIFHIADRACIGRCFSYGNYEPGSGQFRVRANPGNPFVTTSMDASFAIQRGEYIVQPRDLPIFQLRRCNASADELCLHALSTGAVNGQHVLDR